MDGTLSSGMLVKVVIFWVRFVSWTLLQAVFLDAKHRAARVSYMNVCEKVRSPVSTNSIPNKAQILARLWTRGLSCQHIIVTLKQ
jgi:hypothetical protein